MAILKEGTQFDFLNFSGGTASSALLWMVLLGEVERPPHFYVLTADPGMEDSRTYEYINMMERECGSRGVELIRAPGPNLYEDLLNMNNLKRIDNPPYFTIDPKTGKKGRLNQNCTKKYKIEPMNRALRLILERDFAINFKDKRLPAGCARKWIGFTHDEYHRMSSGPREKYSIFYYPLIDRKMTKADILAWMQYKNLPIPPRSVCVACFANSAAQYKEMAREWPADFAKAVAVDKAVRDMSRFGVRGRVFINDKRIELDEVVCREVGDSEENDEGCHSGYCFV